MVSLLRRKDGEEGSGSLPLPSVPHSVNTIQFIGNQAKIYLVVIGGFGSSI